MTVDLSTLKVGDTIVRRDGGVRVITKIELFGDVNPTEYYCSLDWQVINKPKTLCNGIEYTQDGHWKTHKNEDSWDIVEIIHKIEEEEEDKPYSDEYIEYIKSRPPYGTCEGEGLKQWIVERDVNHKPFVDYNPATAKTDTGKDRLDLLPYAGLASAAKALEYGLGEYGHNNYQIATSYRPFLAAAYRHLAKKLDGEDLDTQSGLDHICHALACLMMAEKLKAQGKIMTDPETHKPYGIRNKPKGE